MFTVAADRVGHVHHRPGDPAIGVLLQVGDVVHATEAGDVSQQRWRDARHIQLQHGPPVPGPEHRPHGHRARPVRPLCPGADRHQVQPQAAPHCGASPCMSR